MKKVLCLTLVLTSIFYLSACSLYSNDKNKSLDGWFDGVKSEADADIMGVYISILFKSEDASLNMFKVFHDRINKKYPDAGKNILDVLVIYKSRVYFIVHKGFTRGKHGKWILSVASVDTNGNDFKAIDIGEFGFDLDTSSGYTYSKYNNYEYQEFRQAYVKEKYNEPRSGILSQYYDGAIYVKDIDHTVMVDLETSQVVNCVNSDESVFENRYEVIQNDNEFVVKDKFTLEEKTFNINTVINTACDGKIAELKDKKRWSGESYLENFDYCVCSYVDGNLYFTFSLMNYHGDYKPIVFKYDFENNRLLYLFVGPKKPDCPNGNSYLIPIVE